MHALIRAGLLAGTIALLPFAAVAQETFPVEHERGVTDVPVNPQRVITISALGIEDNLLALGVVPLAGSTFPAAGNDFYPHIAETLNAAGILKVDGNAPNLEYVLSLEPDLIIAEGSQRDNYDKLSMIAPTVLHTFDGDWRSMHRKLGLFLGREAEAEQNIVDLDAAIAPLREEIHAAIGEETVLYAIVMDKRIRIQGTSGHGFNQLVYEDLALTPEAHVPTTEVREHITIEGVSALDPDHLFLQVDLQGGGTEYMAELEASPVWQNLRALKEGNVHVVPTGENWLAMAWGITSRELLAQRIRDALVAE